jgi:hypothetical protein
MLTYRREETQKSARKLHWLNNLFNKKFYTFLSLNKRLLLSYSLQYSLTKLLLAVYLYLVHNSTIIVYTTPTVKQWQQKSDSALLIGVRISESPTEIKETQRGRLRADVDLSQGEVGEIR